jgi:hypothetical protein
MIQLTAAEWAALRSRIVTLKPGRDDLTTLALNLGFASQSHFFEFVSSLGWVYTGRVPRSPALGSFALKGNPGSGWVVIVDADQRHARTVMNYYVVSSLRGKMERIEILCEPRTG